MSLSLRLTLALSVAALALFGAVGVWQIRAEEQDLERAVRHDMELLGRSLQVSFENALRDRQAADVEETLRELERIDPSVDVFVHDAAGAQIAASSGAVPRARWLASRPLQPELHFVHEPSPGHVELLIPLDDADHRTGPATMVITRPLDDMRADLEATRVRVWLSVLSFVVLVALLTMALSRYWVGEPLSKMIAQMRRVRAGDLSPVPFPARTDEVGATLHEFEQLVRDLRATRARLDVEAEARRRMEGQLRELDKMRALGVLAAGLAHEIGSPLTILEGRLAGLEHRADDPAETRRVARILLEQAQRITRIVSRLSTLARRPIARAMDLDATEPARRVIDLLEGEARRRGVQVTLSAGSQPPALRCDPDALQQILLNLLRNALDATSAGGRIEVRFEPSELTSATGQVVPSLRLCVEDDGVGMDEDVRTHALEAFFTTRAERGGSGLGLAVVKGIVDELGGRIELESAPERGTVVRIDLPVDAREERETARAI